MRNELVEVVKAVVSCFCEWDQISVEEPAEKEIEPTQQIHRWAKSTVDNAEHHVDCKTSTVRTNPIIILILWLSHFESILLWHDLLERKRGLSTKVCTRGHTEYD